MRPPVSVTLAVRCHRQVVPLSVLHCPRVEQLWTETVPRVLTSVVVVVGLRLPAQIRQPAVMVPVHQQLDRVVVTIPGDSSRRLKDVVAS